MSPKWPNLFVIGAPRAGTTSLYHFLSQHPEIFVPEVKELRYFAFWEEEADFQGPSDSYTFNESTITERAIYLDNYTTWSSEKYGLDASPAYLYYAERVAPRIQKVVPNPRIIVTLRDPIERAYSDYKNMVRLGREPILDFEKAINLESERIKERYSLFYRYASKGFYWENLNLFRKHIGEDNIKVISFNDLFSHTSQIMSELCDFLGIDSIQFNKEKHNSSKWPVSGLIHKAVNSRWVRESNFPMWGPLSKIANKIRHYNLSEHSPEIGEPLRKRLENMYASEVAQIESEYGVSLWKEK